MPLSVADGPEAWIHDFTNSDDPRFRGKSKEKRRQQALAAFYSAKRKKEDMAILQNAQYLLELDLPNQGKRNSTDPTAVSPQPRGMVTGTSPSPEGSTQAIPVQAPVGPSQPSLDTGDGLSSTSMVTPSSLSTMTGNLLGAQGVMASSATGPNTSSTYSTGTPKELDDLSKSKIPKSDSLLLMSPKELLGG